MAGSGVVCGCETNYETEVPVDSEMHLSKMAVTLGLVGYWCLGTELSLLPGTTLIPHDIPARCNTSIIVVSMQGWADHMADHSSTYIYQKRSF